MVTIWSHVSESSRWLPRLKTGHIFVICSIFSDWISPYHACSSCLLHWFWASSEAPKICRCSVNARLIRTRDPEMVVRDFRAVGVWAYRHKQWFIWKGPGQHGLWSWSRSNASGCGSSHLMSTWVCKSSPSGITLCMFPTLTKQTASAQSALNPSASLNL